MKIHCTTITSPLITTTTAPLFSTLYRATQLSLALSLSLCLRFQSHFVGEWRPPPAVPLKCLSGRETQTSTRLHFQSQAGLLFLGWISDMRELTKRPRYNNECWSWRVTLRCTSMTRWSLHRVSAAAGRKVPGRVRICTSLHFKDFLFGVSVNCMRLCKTTPPKTGNRTMGTGVSTGGHSLELHNTPRGLAELPGQQQPPARETKPGFSFGEIRDNRIKARGQRWLLFPLPLQKSGG